MTDRMRALTLKQPWASAVALGVKGTENRFNPTAYRGPVAIHAGLGWDPDAASDPMVFRAFGTLRAFRNDAPRGMVLAIRDLTSCHRVQTSQDGHATCCADPWALTDYAGRAVTAHIVWGTTRVLDRPVPATGQQGWWFLSDAARAEILDQIGALT